MAKAGGRRLGLLVSLFAFGLALSAAGADKLTDEKVEDLELELMDAAPSDAVRLLGPYLGKPDKRLAPLIAEVLSRGVGLAVDDQKRLFKALLPVANQQTFPAAKKMVTSPDPVLARFGAQIMGRTKHLQAGKALTAYYARGKRFDDRLAALMALGDLEDRGVEGFLRRVMDKDADVHLRDEAVISFGRIGLKVPPAAMLRANASVREWIAALRKNLNYTKRAHPGEYKIRMKHLAIANAQVARLDPLLKALCTKRPAEVAAALGQDQEASVADWFVSYLPILADKASVESLAALLAHRSDSLAQQTVKQLLEKGKSGEQAIQTQVLQMAKVGDGKQKERAALLARALPSRLVKAMPGFDKLVGVEGVAVTAAERPAIKKPAYDYILWDGFRFASDAAAQKRDVRWVRDLGFTHCLLGANLSAKASGEGAQKTKALLDLFDAYGLIAGLRYGWDLDLQQFGVSKQEMVANGMQLLRAKADGMHPTFNPLHPDIIAHFARAFGRSTDQYGKLDPHGRIRFFLIGSERTWGFPNKAYPKAMEIVYRAARKDGVLKEGEPDNLEAIKEWWGDPHGKGRDWHLRKAIADEVHKRIPDARFMIDPTWAIKIVDGFGATWTYIGNDPKNVATAVVGLKAVTFPSPCAHSTQLIRGCGHDALMEANLLSICLGADKLYHWGANTFEPGRELAPAYGDKSWEPTPEGFPWFRRGHVPAKAWPGLLEKIFAQRETPAGERLWSALGKKLQTSLEENATFDELETGDDTALIKAVVAGLNHVLKRADLYEAKAFAEIKVTARTTELLARQERMQANEGEGLSEDQAELNRLLIEVMFKDCIPQTYAPNLRQLREEVRAKRASKEPALRSTGRLLRDRGELFRDWKPMGPRLALLGGVYGKTTPVMPFLVGHIPVDILRSQQDRRARLRSYTFVAVSKPTVSAEDYADLLKIEAAGGVIFVTPEFKPPQGATPLKRAVAWDRFFKNVPKPGSTGAKALREAQHARARVVRELCHHAGLRPVFDSENLDIIMQGYTYQGQKVLMVVNDLRTFANPAKPGKQEDKGLPNPVDILVRDAEASLEVMNIDTGKPVKVEKREDGWHILDTLPPAWYRLYAVLGANETWKGPGPLAAAPAIKHLQAKRTQAGVKLTWSLDVDDWVGSDAQWIRIERQDAKGGWHDRAQVYARIPSGAGGIVSAYVDRAAEASRAKAYRIRVVTPLHVDGPVSEVVPVEP